MMKNREMIFLGWVLLAMATDVCRAEPVNFMIGDISFVRPTAWEWVQLTDSAKITAKLLIHDKPGQESANVVFLETKATTKWATAKETIARWKDNFQEPHDQLRLEEETLSFGKRKVAFVHLEGTYKTLLSNGKIKLDSGFAQYGAIIEQGESFNPGAWPQVFGDAFQGRISTNDR